MLNNDRMFAACQDARFLARYWRKVRRGTAAQCWEWTGALKDTGYGQINSRPGKPGFKAHRISWTIASGRIPDGMFVCHKCDNRPCVNPDHLFLGRHRDNMRDAVVKNRMLGGSRHPHARLTEADVVHIRARAKAGEFQSAIARDYQVAQTVIGDVVRGKSWRLVGNGSDLTHRGHSPMRGTVNPSAKLNDAAVREIRRRASSSKQLDLSAEYGVSRSTICGVVAGLTWKHVV